MAVSGDLLSGDGARRSQRHPAVRAGRCIDGPPRNLRGGIQPNRRPSVKVEGGVYARLTAIPDDPYKDVGPEPVAALLPEFEGLQRHFSDGAGH